jgi:uncharacterized delta-60 repeat protein
MLSRVRKYYDDERTRQLTAYSSPKVDRSRPTARTTLSLALLMFILLATTACGGGDPAPPQSSAGRTPTAAKLTGQLDPTFGTEGKVTTDFGSENEEVHALVAQPDGKIVAAGSSWPGLGPHFTLARYNADGSLDSTFGDGGKVVTNMIGDEHDYASAHALLQQPDGKLIAVGDAYQPDLGHAVFALARYNADGTLDSTFGADGKVLAAVDREPSISREDEGHAAALAPDGKIVVGGVSGLYPQDFALMRFNTDGSVDTTFGTEGRVTTDFGASDTIQGVAVLPDGKILAAGYGGKEEGNENEDFALARYNVDGSLDSGFGTGGKVLTDVSTNRDEAAALVVRPNGKIVVGGPAYVGVTFCATDACRYFGFALAQYNPDGSLDKSFGKGGTAMQDFALSSADYALQLLPDGRLAAVGYLDDNDFGLALFTPNGSLIDTLGKKGKIIARFGPYRDTAYAVALQPDGKIVIAGAATVDPKNILNADFALARFR